MQTVTLYRYNGSNSRVIISPVKPDGAYTTALRLIADEGKALTKDGQALTPCVDVDSADGWYEVDHTDTDDIDENI